MDTEKVRRYFERIGMTMPKRIIPDGELLDRLHYMHSISIPYENLDFVTGKLTPTDADTAYSSVVLNHRGGLCLDLNTLFGWLLEELGYGVEYVGSYMSDLPETSIRWHKVLRANDCNGKRWWCDVARTHSSAKHPFLMEPDLIQEQDGEAYRFEEGDNDSWSLWLYVENEWIKKFEASDWNTTLNEANEQKFTTNIRFPDHGIVTGRYFEIRTPFGRRSLHGNIYREYVNNMVYKFECSSETLPWAYAQFGLGDYI